jgi:hypothetical protein
MPEKIEFSLKELKNWLVEETASMIAPIMHMHARYLPSTPQKTAIAYI